MNIDNLKNKNIHFVECENWHDVYGYEKSQMKEDTINYIEQLQQKNQKLQERIEYLERSNNRREDTILEQRQEISDLEDNWNKLKEYLYNQIPTDKTVLTKHIKIFEVLDKIKELEQRSNEEN